MKLCFLRIKVLYIGSCIHLWPMKTSCQLICLLSALLNLGFISSVSAAALSFTSANWQPQGGLELRGQVESNRLITVLASSDLTQWRTLAVLDQREFAVDAYQPEAVRTNFNYRDSLAAPADHRFYRFALSDFDETSDGKNQLLLPNDGYASEPPGMDDGQVRWIKFIILREDPTRVFFQDSQKYLLHVDFATNRFPQFYGLSQIQFDRVSLYLTNQQALLGTVLLPPKDGVQEYGVQLSSRDPLPRELVLQCLDAVRNSVLAPAGTQLLYLPSFEQSEIANANEAFYQAHDIALSTINRWLSGNQVYAQGWALGRLVFVTARGINQAYLDGTLRATDILMTDGVPAEVPQVAGIISTTPATPNSHVAILASTFGIPFVYVSDSNLLRQAQQLQGTEMVLQARIQSGFGLISVIGIDGSLTPELRQELLDLKQPVSPQIMPKIHRGAYSAFTDNLSYSDIRFFGGKAAQFGYLRRSVPTNSPEAIAFSFDLWDDFMAQTLPTGRTLVQEISNRLAGVTYPPNMPMLETNLAAIRELITKTARFSPQQQLAILTALSGFSSERNLRFRSSSNAEDSDTYAAAGLYDSYSGCLADDLDQDTVGPCRCDPTETNERGVFRAMQKTYASFYNNNAFLERLRHRIDESKVGMGLLVHYSTPDTEEMANGVATVAFENSTAGFGSFPVLKANMVTQAGAVSITNPEGNAKPEVVTCAESSMPELLQSSSLVPWGSHVLTWTDEYEQLATLLFKVYRAYQQTQPGGTDSSSLLLDMEYKKVAPGQLMLKQVRSLPQPGSQKITPYILNQPATYWVYQREGSDVFANHRLKCLLTLETLNGQLNESNLTRCLYPQARLEIRQDQQVQVLSGAPSSWPEAQHRATLDTSVGWVVSDRWVIGQGSNRYHLELVSTVPLSQSAQAPFLSSPEIRKKLLVNYAIPQPVYSSYQNQTLFVTNEEVALIQAPAPDTLQPEQPLVVTNNPGLKFECTFMISTNQTGPTIDEDKSLWGYYVASLSPWAHATITGLLPTPIILTNYYAVSSMPGHKRLQNFCLFEPRLDPGVPADQLLLLATRDIRLIYLEYSLILKTNRVLVMGANGQFRKP
jgi:hypothetical protein